MTVDCRAPVDSDLFEAADHWRIRDKGTDADLEPLATAFAIVGREPARGRE